MLRRGGVAGPTTNESSGSSAKKDCHCADGAGRQRLSHPRVPRERPVGANQTWAAGFIHDSLINGRRFRAFAVLDQWSRESIAIEVDFSLTGERVARFLEQPHPGVGYRW
jgi:putative transposase